MVKLSNSIGATNISQSTRLVTPLSNSMFEVTHTEFVDDETMMRFFPFTDLEYNSAEAAQRDNIIASARVPMITHISAPGTDAAIRAPPKVWGRDAITRAFHGASKSFTGKDQLKYLLTGAGAVDYMLGIDPIVSVESILLPVDANGDPKKLTTKLKLDEFTNKRDKMWDTAVTLGAAAKPTQVKLNKKGEFSWDDTLVAGTTGPSMNIVQCLTENEAIEVVSSDVRLRTIAYVIGPRDVQLYFSDSVIGGMVRRMRHLVERYGPCIPHHWPIGLGHLAESNDAKNMRAQAPPVQQLKGRKQADKLKVAQPTWGWSAGAIGYKSGSMPASGQIYMPDDYIPYTKRKRSYKFNHLQTQVGMELMEVLSAVGIDLQGNLDAFDSGDRLEKTADPLLAMLQIMYSDPLMFGTTDNPDVGDVTLDEAGLTTAVKSMMGMFFDSAHTHVDPGALSFGNLAGKTYMDTNGRFSETVTSRLQWKGLPISAAGLMREFIGRYIVFLLTTAAMRPYFKVPVFPMHLLYYGGPRPELVTEQLLMNFRPDWDFGGSSGLPYSLVPTRLNPGETAVRIPTLFDYSDSFNMKSQCNMWLGPREPVVFTEVEEIRFRGDKPQSVIEKANYYFSPIVEPDAHVSGTYRNHRNVTVAHLPRPSYYTPGCNQIGWVLGTMSDNSKVSGQQYVLPGTYGYSNEATDGFTNPGEPQIYRPMLNSPVRDSKLVTDDLWPTQAAQSASEQQAMAAKMNADAIEPDKNRQTVGEKAGGKLDVPNDLGQIMPESLGGNPPRRTGP